MSKIETIIKYTKKLNLLYVEDNEDAMSSSMLILQEFFNEIITAVDGKDGLNKFKKNKDKINIIITDINMPKLTGLEMIREIKEIEKDIPVIVLSAYNETEFFVKSIKLGIQSYLLKPINVDEFIDTLEKVTKIIQLKEESEAHISIMQQYQEVINEISSISKTDPKGIITYVNDSYCKISGYSENELIGKNHNIIRHKGNKPSFYKKMWNTIKVEKKTWQGTVRNISKSGKNYYAKTIIKPILDSDGNIIEHIALRDNITNIMNPNIQIRDLITLAEFPIICLIKVELFDDMEIFYGQSSLQDIDKKFSNELYEVMPKIFGFDRAFILGNGQYAFARDIKDCHLNLNDFISGLEEFQEYLNQRKINFKDIEYYLSSLISVAYGNNALENSKYGLKKINEKKQSFIIANNLVQSEQNKAKENLETLKSIKEAINNSKIVSYFQPIINNKTLKIEKYESLVRLIDKNNQTHLPSYFLNIAKKTKYYLEITAIAMENSFKALRNTDKEISINLSALDIERRNIRNKIIDLLNKNKSNCNRITFELLEDENIKDFNKIKNFIIKIKELGVKIAIDDFGTGYSNFQRLLDYQPDILKIDGSLMKNIETDLFSLSILETLISFAKKQNIKTIAEYVENENIFNILLDLGVDYSQGFYFGKAEPFLAKD